MLQDVDIFHDIHLLAKLLTKGKSCLTYILGQGLIAEKIRPYYYSWYGYFRWVDDLADSNTLSENEKHQFIQRQLMLVNYLYDNCDNLQICKTGELFLASLILYDTKRGSNLKDSIIDLLNCIYYDVRRIGKIPQQIELEKFIELEVTSYLKTLYYFCDPRSDLKNFPIPYEGIAGKLAHILRDFISDFENGIINISKEEVNRFNIRENDLWGETCESVFKEWVRAKVGEARLNFSIGKENLFRHHCLKYKVAVTILCAKYEHILDLIERDNFALRREKYNNLFITFRAWSSFIYYLMRILLLHFRYSLMKGKDFHA